MAGVQQVRMRLRTFMHFIWQLPGWWLLATRFSKGTAYRAHPERLRLQQA